MELIKVVIYEHTKSAEATFSRRKGRNYHIAIKEGKVKQFAEQPSIVTLRNGEQDYVEHMLYIIYKMAFSEDPKV